ncbi:hypothetical protein ACO2Q9_18550 [Variovorax sp. VNK109]|uniref:hypothetical protein n=1 Tax=Variovorax sp. VNK109 TaxID=3400919 RepID=UPI003C123549
MTHLQDMTDERFRTLADAYGGDLNRWPLAEQAGARWLLAQSPAALSQVLADAAGLDALLAQHEVDMPALALRERIVAGAPAPGAGRSDARQNAGQDTGAWGRAVLWWSGFGAAGVGLAGAVAGAFAVSFALSSAAPQALDGWMDGASAFSAGQTSSDWGDE